MYHHAESFDDSGNMIVNSELLEFVVEDDSRAGTS